MTLSNAVKRINELPKRFCESATEDDIAEIDAIVNFVESEVSDKGYVKDRNRHIYMAEVMTTATLGAWNIGIATQWCLEYLKNMDNLYAKSVHNGA